MSVACEPCRRRKMKCDPVIPSCGLCTKYAIQSPDSPETYPITFRWYMPRLIRQLIPGSCLFLATLFSGSSYFDLHRGEEQSQITLFHQNEVIKLINERLSNLCSALDDRTILAISPLALFAELNGDRAAADIDRAGLQRMAELRGGLDKLGLDGLTSVLIKMNSIVYCIAFDSDPDFAISARPLPPPLGLESRIINTIIAPKQAPLRCTHTFKLRFYFSTNKRPNERAKSFAAIIDGKTRPLEALVMTLKASLALTDDGAAAVVRDARSRLWFYFKQASSVRVLHLQNESSFLDDLWSHFHWLRTFRLNLEQSSITAVSEQAPI
ncbi:hypothetical protein BDV29DRAFT_189052 [Aspergillus leporis]|uniref:Zn(2)-C6 fungal-type domain-containing protein n=1 Tax=Aspergillus leporis TaxID=41062 RepID=A0A5N5XC60_9EURO|nr:hypothetical protein BDV29DRAFT_189052 [Aspergillus leporis]